jgi:hypothetical protein
MWCVCVCVEMSHDDVFGVAQAAGGAAPTPGGISFEMTAEQKEFQQLARKFTADEIIPKVSVMCVMVCCDRVCLCGCGEIMACRLDEDDDSCETHFGL